MSKNVSLFLVISGIQFGGAFGEIKNANQLFTHPAQANNRLHKLSNKDIETKPHTKSGLRKFRGRQVT